MQLTLRSFIPILLPALSLSSVLQEPHRDIRQRQETAEGTVRALYELVTFGPGSVPDWGSVRMLFADEAVIVLRTARDTTKIFSAEEFIDDFRRFAGRPQVQERGFQELVVRMKPMVFGDMASVLVLYEASIPGRGRPPQQGVDAFLLRKDGREWKIVAISNEIVTPERPPPAQLSEE